MFGVSRNKKKPLATIRATAFSSSDDDNEEEEHRRRNLGKKREKKKSKKKKMQIGASSSAGLSFDPGEVDDELIDDVGLLDNVKSSSKKRKKHSKQGSSSKKSSKKSKHNSSGFGYGGGVMMMMDASDESASDAEENQDQTTTTSQYYDVAALQKLKMAQKQHGKKNVEKKNQTVEQHKEDVEKEQTSHVEKNEEEFIPLADTKPKHNRLVDPIVLTGDEALAFVEKEEEGDPSEFDHGLQSQPKPPQKSEITEGDNEQIEEEVEEGNRQWEDTMARRAGVLPSSGTSQQSDVRHHHHHRHHHRNKVKSKSSSIAEIKSSLQPTINNLENVSSDLATSIHRQQSTITSTKDELTKHQSTLQDHGKALEYYQGLRADLATWMGALRELDGMVSLAEDALRRWEVDVTWKKLERFFEWGEDCTSVLEKQGLLESKFTCNDDSEADQAPAVDEFGRVVSSKAAMARMKRLDRRQKIQSQRLEIHPNLDSDIASSSCINEDNFDVREIDEWKQRYKALNDAVALIPNSVKDDYRSIANLCQLFIEWQRLHPEDYKTSFAEMSLVKMASVLVRLELCQRWDLLGLSKSIDGDPRSQHVDEISDFKCFQCFKSNSEKSFTECVLLQVIEKEIVPRLLRSLSFYDETNGGENTEHLHGVYNPFSAQQTKHLCTFLKSLLGYMSTEETDTGSSSCKKITESVSGALLSLVKKCIERMTISIINPSNVEIEKNTFVTKDGAIEFDRETNDAIAFAIVVQAKELCTLVINVLQLWYPIIRDKAGDLLKFVFTDIISQRIIPVVQALQTTSNECNCDLGKTLIGDILDAASGLPDEKEWMIQAAPLRVAAQTMGLANSGK